MIIDNNDPVLLDQLTKLLSQDAPTEPFAAWLAEQGDPRARHVHALAAAQRSLPATRPKGSRSGFTLYCKGSWWEISLGDSAILYQASPPSEGRKRLASAHQSSMRPMSREKQTPEVLRREASTFLRDLIFELFDTSRGELEDRQATGTTENQ